VSPALTASQVSASEQHHDAEHLEPGDDARSRAETDRHGATRTTTGETRLAITEVITCPHRTAERAIGIDWNRSKIPLEMSVKSLNAV
jgi:hypothetical protein